MHKGIAFCKKKSGMSKLSLGLSLKKKKLVVDTTSHDSRLLRRKKVQPKSYSALWINRDCVLISVSVLVQQYGTAWRRDQRLCHFTSHPSGR